MDVNFLTDPLDATPLLNTTKQMDVDFLTDPFIGCKALVKHH
jgi:hypothetical protein